MSEFKEKVDGLVGKMVETDGKWELPEDVGKDLDEPTLYAVNAERRVRDNQRAVSRAQQSAKQHEAAANALEAHILDNTETPLTDDQRTELNTLKTENPEAWRAKLNEYETQGKGAVADNLKKIREDSAAKGELEIRKEQMSAWAESTGIALNDDIIANDLPPRYLKDLENGAVSFEEFLANAGEFLTANKIIQGSDEDADDDTKNLGDVAGGKEPSDRAQDMDDAQSYEKTMF